MFGLGITEIVLVFFAVIIFIRPQDFPQLVKSIGKLYGKWQRLYYGVVNDLHALAPEDSEARRQAPQETVQREKE
jgi:Sec-independent protein translocase protein TatA